MDRSGSFLCKKWSLFTVASILIVGCVLIIALTSSLVETAAKSNPITNNEDVKDFAKNFLIIVGLIGIVINVIGLMGAYKEHFSMTIAYAILMIFNAFGGIIDAVKTPSHWYSPVISIIIAVLAFSYAYDLNVLRQRMMGNTFGRIPVQTETVVQMNTEVDGHQYNITSYGYNSPPAYESRADNYSKK